MVAIGVKRHVLAVALSAAALVLSCHGASAQYFGAIGFSQTSGALGWGFDYPSQEGAEAAALQNCRKHAPDCKIAIFFENACAVIAVGDSNGYGTAWHASRVQAERQALIACRSETKNCTVVRWVCTTKSAY